MATRTKRGRATGAKTRPAADGDDIRLRIRLRLYSGDEIALGPGKADLLTAIHTTGSLTEAAQSLDMSYMRAWSLVRTMNRCFASPLVKTVRGGSSGGQAHLTDLGREVLALYREMTSAGLRATRPALRQLRARLRT